VLYQAAEQGYVDAYFALGEIYLHQPGGKKDRVQAYYWLGMAKKHGHPRGDEEFERNRKAMTPEQIELAKKSLEVGAMSMTPALHPSIN
jgi:TPR repeat protein